MTTKIKPQRIDANNSPQVGYVPKYVDEQTFEWGDVSGGGGTGIVPAFNEPYADDTYTTREPINEGQHCSYGIYGIYLVKDDENIRESLNPGPGFPVININFGQCFELFETNNVVDIISKLLLSYSVGATTVDYSLTADIYAISGTYGVDAIPVGPSLYNSSISGNWNGITEPTLTFNFSTPIPAGQYCVKITGTLSKGSGSDIRSNLDVQILGTNSPYYTGNTVDGSTPIPGQNMYINIITSDIGVFLSNGISDITSDWRGVATETKGVNESIVLQKRGETTQTGANNDGAIRYLSDVYGELSLTRGTNARIIGQGSDTDKIWMGRTHYHEMNDINEGEVYYTNTGGLCGGWFKNAVGSSVTTAISISISEDNIIRELLQSNQYDQSTGGQNIGIQAYIPAGYYFKIDAASTTTITSERYYFNPIK